MNLIERLHWIQRPGAESETTVLCAEAADEIERLTAERDALRKDYERACLLVAQMHLAATGSVTGPAVGVVEDVAAMKVERDTWEKRARDYGWPDCGELAQMTAERDALLAFLVDLLSVLEPVYQTSPEGRAYLLRINTALAAIDAARKA